MKIFRSVSLPFALRAFLLLAFVSPVAWVYANSGAVTTHFLGRTAMHHTFKNQASSPSIVINRGFYAAIYMTYAGETFYSEGRMSGPRQTNFNGGTTSPLDWYQTITVRIETYREDTNEKIDTFNWSGKLSQDPGVGFQYRCKEVPGNNQTPVQAALRFYYLGGTDPDSRVVNVYVK